MTHLRPAVTALAELRSAPAHMEGAVRRRQTAPVSIWTDHPTDDSYHRRRLRIGNGKYRRNSSVGGEPFDGLPGQFSDEVEVLVEVEDHQTSEFRGGSDQQVRDGRGAMLSPIGE